MSESIKVTPEQIAEEYKKGTEYKNAIGDKGIFEQARMNERFFVGDQWRGVNAGNNKPLTRLNVIKRIGEYKISTIGASPIAVNYSADGVPDTKAIKEKAKEFTKGMYEGDGNLSGTANEVEISAVTSAMSDYFRTTAERVKFEQKKDRLLRKAYISGTGVCHTYWDPDIETGLYADEGRTTPIKGDIAFETIDIENVVFGDPNSNDVQSQPFIIIARRITVAEALREARRNRQKTDQIKSENSATDFNSGDRGEKEPDESQKITVYTKFFKEYSNDDKTYKVCAIRVTEKAVIRPKWELNLKNYPIAKFVWDERNSSAYGDSEITYIIPNQIAINRALTAQIWATMAHGMPKLLVNGDVIRDPVTNDPGEILKVYCATEDISNALKYVVPPQFNGLEVIANDIANNTLTYNGANDAALGQIRPDNASAIIAAREAALQPMQMYQNRFYDFIEDIARIWADFWINYYGKRKIKIVDKSEIKYLQLDTERYKNLMFTARVDVGASTMWSQSITISTLDSMLINKVITFEEYLERLPKNLIPDVTGLLENVRQRTAAQQPPVPTEDDNFTDEDIMNDIAAEDPELYAQYNAAMNPQELEEGDD